MYVQSVEFFTLKDYFVAAFCDSFLNSRSPKFLWWSKDKVKNQAIEDIKAADPQIHLDYLQCYGLIYNEKSKCVLKLNNKYIKPEFIKNPHYANSYVYKAEKLGFLQFLKNKEVPCDNIINSPKYTSETESYVAKCTDGNIYLLRFDCDKKEWKLIK